MTVVTEILNSLADVNKPQEKFLSVLFATMLVIHSAINFLSLSRHCDLSERTFRRQFRKDFDFAAFNLKAAEKAACSAPKAVAMDASFIKKSGKHTFGLDTFYNGVAQRAEKGLEVSLVALIETEANRSFALSAEQTPAAPPAAASETAQETRIDFYLLHFRRAARGFPASVRYTLVDGFYAKEKFVSGVCKEGLEVISRLRTDANLRFLYQGEQRGGRGRPRKYDGKVDFSQLERFDLVETDDSEQFSLYTQRVWAVSLKREIRVLVLVFNQKAKQRKVVLFSTDVELAAKEILRLYRSRFQIEFLFREAKQSAGLESCQARDGKALSFHFNAAFAAVNLARVIEAENKKPESEINVFSMKSIKQRLMNEHLLELFISRLDLDAKVIKNHPNYEKLRNYAVIST